MSERLMRVAYRLATILLLPVVFGYFYWRGRREPAYRHGWRQRLGYIDALPANATWIHAASVGEVALAEPLVRALIARNPNQAIVVTTFTPTGAERVLNRLPDVAKHCYLPLDTAAATRRFVRRLQPRCGIIIETELWPHLLMAAARARIPIIIANASISARSARRYQHSCLAALMRPALTGVTGIGAATAEHGKRFQALGVPAAKVHVIGNLKYDIAPDATLPAIAADLRRQWQAQQRPVWVAASTHEGEEEIVLAAHQRLRASNNNAVLVLAPRHPQRFDSVRDLLQREGWSFAVRSADGPVRDHTAVVLADTLGEVPLFYALADIAFVGGSLLPGIGGHNILEAAALARPLLVGPHTEEWQQITDTLEQAGALCVVNTTDILANCLHRWLQEPDSARRAGAAAQAVCEAERGALGRLLAMLADIQ